MDVETHGLMQFVLISCRVATPDYVSFEIKTEAPDGIILWQGRVRDSYIMICVLRIVGCFLFLFRQFPTKLALNFKPTMQSNLFS